MQLSLPQGKLDELRYELEALMQRKRASKQQLQFLAGKLNWAASVVYSGRVFLPILFMHFASYSTKRTRYAYRMKPTKTLLGGTGS